MELVKKIKPIHTDKRGDITKILDKEGVLVRSILLITSRAGSVRANHYHKKDSHYSYLLSGKMEYYERPVEGGRVESVILEAGDMVYTPPMAIHAMKFLEDSVFLAFATQPRDQINYEDDTVKVELISG